LNRVLDFSPALPLSLFASRANAQMPILPAASADRLMLSSAPLPAGESSHRAWDQCEIPDIVGRVHLLQSDLQPRLVRVVEQ
jgi:hypothetical protein